MVAGFIWILEPYDVAYSIVHCMHQGFDISVIGENLGLNVLMIYDRYQFNTLCEDLWNGHLIDGPYAIYPRMFG